MAPDQSSDDRRVPKLSFGQRLLAALPDLQRSGGAGGARQVDRAGSVKPDAVIPPRSTPRASAGLRGGARRAAPPLSGPLADMEIPELRSAMKSLDDQERRLAMLFGPVIAALDVVLTIAALHNNPAVGHKGHTSPGNILAIGIGSAVIAGLVVVAGAVRRRSFAIFALLFSGYGGGIVTMIPAWAMAGWLFVRFNRMQKALVAKGGGPQAARAAAAERRRNKKKAPEPAGPSPNKRYTPPKPVRVRPPSPG